MKNKQSLALLSVSILIFSILFFTSNVGDVEAKKMQKKSIFKGRDDQHKPYYMQNIKNSTTVKPKPLSVVAEPKKINLISFSYPSVIVGDSYGFQVRAFNYTDNKKSDFLQNSGYLQGVSITLNILTKDGKLVKQFNGVTGKTGYYEGSFRVPDNFGAGTYYVTINATKDRYLSDSDQTFLHVFERFARSGNNTG